MLRQPRFRVTSGVLGDFDRDFFARRPFRSYYFGSGTLMLVFFLFLGVVLVVRHWAQLPDFGLVWLAVGTAGLLRFWIQALRSYLELHELYAQGEFDKVSSGSPLDVGLRVAAAMISSGLFFACFIAFALLMALGSALQAR